MKIILKRPKTKIEREVCKYEYYIYVSNIEVGMITMKKYLGYMLIGNIEIYKEYRRKGYAYDTLQYIFNHYKIKGIIGEIIDSTNGKRFWNYSIKKLDGCKIDSFYCSNTICSFIIPKQDISNLDWYDILKKTYYIL